MNNDATYMSRLAASFGSTGASCGALLIVVLCVGCQPSTSRVSGVVTVDGKPLAIGSDSRGTIMFQPAGGQGALATGILDATGHFKLATGATSDVAPGKYQVAISVVQLLPPAEHAEQGGKRLTPAKYSSAIDSGLQAEVLPGENNIPFDLVSEEEITETPGVSEEPSVESQQAVTPESTPDK